MREEHDDGGLSAGDRELEGMLRALPPASVRIDPLAAAFEAGQRSQRRTTQAWRIAAGLMLLVGSAGWLFPARHQVDSGPHRVVTVIAGSTQPIAPLPDHSLLMIQQAVGERGLDALPAAQLPAVGAVNARDLL